MTEEKSIATSRRRLRWGPMVVLAILLATAGCQPSLSACAREGYVCVGLVTDFGPVSGGLSQEAWLALEDARASGSAARVDYVETIDVRDRGPNVLALAEQGYDVIVTVGAGSADEALRTAARFPDIRFIGVQATTEEETVPSNYSALIFHEERSGFLAGALAARASRTGRVAAICEVEYIESNRRTCEGFRRGVEFIDAGAKVDVRYRTGSTDLLFQDTAWGRTTANDCVDQGADVVFAIGEGTAEAALLAAAQGGALVIGAQVDRYWELPDIQEQMLSSAVVNVRAGLLQMLQDSAAGRLASGAHYGNVGLAPLRALEGSLAPEIIAELGQLESDLNAGRIEFEVEP